MFHLLLIVTLSFWMVPTMLSCGKASKTKTETKESKSLGLKQQKPEDMKEPKVEGSKQQKLDEELKKDEGIKADEKKEMSEDDDNTIKGTKKKRSPEEEREYAEKRLKKVNEYLSTKEKFAEELSHWTYLTLQDSLNTCAYYENFNDCDSPLRMREAYYSMRRKALSLAEVSTKVEVRRWLLAEIRMSEVYLPLMETVIKENFDQLHKGHCVPETYDELMKAYRTILAHHELIEKTWKTYEKQEPGAEKDESEFFKEPEKWMNREIFGEKETRHDLGYDIEPTVLDTCKKQFGGECDFRERMNYYVDHERMLAELLSTNQLRERVYKMEKVCKWMDVEVKYADAYLPLIKEKMAMHKEHNKDMKRVEEDYDKHVMTIEKIKKYRKEIEKRDPEEEVNRESLEQKFFRPSTHWSFFERGYVN